MKSQILIIGGLLLILLSQSMRISALSKNVIALDIAVTALSNENKSAYKLLNTHTDAISLLLEKGKHQ